MTRSEQTLQKFTVKVLPDEVIPLFVQTDELLPLYHETDLSFRYVYQHCLNLSTMKGIPLAVEQISLWYAEMLREKWNKQKFDEQLQAMKAQKIFGSFDWAQWQEGIEMIPAQTVKERAIAEVNRYADAIRFQTRIVRSSFDHVAINRAAIAVEELRQARMELVEVISRKEEEMSYALRKEANAFFQKVKESGDISEIEKEFPDLTPEIIRGSLRQFCNIYFYKKQSQEQK